MLNDEIMSVVKTLRQSEEIATKNPLPRLLRLMEKRRKEEGGDGGDGEGSFGIFSQVFAKIFFSHRGVYYLCQAMDLNKTNPFNEDAIM